MLVRAQSLSLSQYNTVSYASASSTSKKASMSPASTTPKVASPPAHSTTKPKTLPTLVHRPLSVPIQTSTSNAVDIDPTMTERSWQKYDDERAVQQCEAYAKWLNHIFQNPDIGIDDCGHASNSEVVTLRALSSQRRRAQASQRAQQYYQSRKMQMMKCVIEEEVRNKSLFIRKDHDVFANVNLRGQLISLLMSYSTPWLRLGLETIFGEVISIGFAESTMRGQVKVRKSLGIVQADPKKVREVFATSVTFHV